MNMASYVKQAGVLLMPFRTNRKAATTDDDPETEPKREIERWRVAVDIIRRLREAGISCELRNRQNRH